MMEMNGKPTNTDILTAIDDMLEQQGEMVNVEKLFEYLDTLEESAPVSQEFDVQVSRDKLDMRIEHLKQDEILPAEKKKRKRWLKPVLLVAAIVSVLTLTVTATIYETDLLDGIVSWVGEVFKTGSDSGVMWLQARSESGYRSMKEALAEYDLDTTTPKWIPPEYSISEIRVTEADILTEIIGTYQSDDNKELTIITVILGSGVNTLVEKTPESDYVINHRGQQYGIIKNHDMTQIFWGTQIYETVIIGPLSHEETEKIIKSIGE